ncbi:hypothetical protein MKW92_014705, partial [Papaver armeniacum]
MCARLRRLEEKVIVAVVGLGHMDGIELLWKLAEDVGDDNVVMRKLYIGLSNVTQLRTIRWLKNTGLPTL